MWQYIKAHPVNVALSVLFVIAFGLTTFFLISGNRDLRQENRQHRKQISEHESAITALEQRITERDKAIAERDTLIAKSKIATDSLSKKYDELNRRIVKDFPRYDVAVSLDVDSQISVITRFLRQADSLSR